MSMFLSALAVTAALACIFFPDEIRALHCRVRAYRYFDATKKRGILHMTNEEFLQGIECRAAELSKAGADITAHFDSRVSEGAGFILSNGGCAMLELIDACKAGIGVDWYYEKVGTVCREAEHIAHTQELQRDLKARIEGWANDVREWAHTCHVLVPYFVARGVLKNGSVIYASWGQR